MIDITALPFVLQRIIMDYAPNLPAYANKERIRRHLDSKYCGLCGDYIDIYSPIGKKKPRHCHFRKKKWKYEFKSWKYVSEKLFFIHLHKSVKNSIPSNIYFELMRLGKDNKFRFVFRQRGVRYFYSIKWVVNNKSLLPFPKTSILDSNIYTNPDFFLEHNHAMSQSRYFSKIVSFQNVYSSFHHKTIRDTIDMLIQTDYTCFEMFIYYFIEHPEFMYDMVENHFFSFLYYIQKNRLSVHNPLVRLVLEKYPEFIIFVSDYKN